MRKVTATVLRTDKPDTHYKRHAVYNLFLNSQLQFEPRLHFKVWCSLQEATERFNAHLTPI
jgi:hypothetical protein